MRDGDKRKDFTSNDKINRIQLKNKIISYINFLIALAIFVFILVRIQFISRDFENDNITIVNIDKNKSISMQFKLTLNNTYTFQDKYVLLHNNTNLISNKNNTFNELIKFYDFSINTYYIIAAILVAVFFCIILSYSIKHYNFQIFMFYLNLILSNQSFNCLVGIMFGSFKDTFSLVYVFLNIQIILKVCSCYFNNVLLKRLSIYSIGILTSTLLEIIYMYTFVAISETVHCYISSELITNIFCIIVSYYFSRKKETINITAETKTEQYNYEIYRDALEKMGQGFISYSTNFTYINKFLLKIINRGTTRNQIDLSDKISQINLRVNRSTFLENNLNESNLLNKDYSNAELNITGSNKKQNNILIFKSNTANLNKENLKLIEMLMTNFSEINPELSSEIYNFIKNGFKLNEFYLKLIKDSDEFEDFIHLGIVSLPDEIKLQVMFRLYKCSKEEFHLQFIVNDVTNLIYSEREKAVEKTRENYTTKIAHEFKNSISNILELTSCIIEQTKIHKLNGEPDLKLVKFKANYIDKLCRIMTNFLNDYNIFSNIKFYCGGENTCPVKSDNCILCEICLYESLCKKCKFCKSCYQKNDGPINISKMIKNMIYFFNSLARYEKEINRPKFVEETELNINYILIGTEMFLRSAIYNILFNSYKTSVCNNAVISIKVNQSMTGEKLVTTIEINNNSQEINSEFISMLLNCPSHDIQLNLKNSSSILNKHFEIYIAFYFLKKIDSKLNIESSPTGNKFSFTISNRFNPNLHRTASILSLNSYEEINKSESSADESLYQKSTVIFEDPFIRAPSRFSRSGDYIRKSSLNNTLKISLHQCLTINSIKMQNLLLSPPHEMKQIIQRQETFHLNLNASFEGDLEEEEKKEEENEIISIKPTRILIIDDETMVRATLKRNFSKLEKLKNFTFKIEEASNCFDAINLLYRSLVNNTYFDFIVIDEFIPNMYGSTLIKLFKQLNMEGNFYNINFISHTAFDSVEKRKSIMDAGADHIFIKPIQFKDFKEFFSKKICELLK